ncbi:hypothetical protein B0T17DRAFT_613654 [Bombardia bombarda]|uniref:BHLH domain-containing protein n=1 Tax=Bombardia bombarda TaxID=252184 RepID=A0AA39XPZ9_9PEZI|nr:hypothetical protein B0T17DRAFT_613654 [Bombardia bombarda]
MNTGWATSHFTDELDLGINEIVMSNPIPTSEYLDHPNNGVAFIPWPNVGSLYSNPTYSPVAYTEKTAYEHLSMPRESFENGSVGPRTYETGASEWSRFHAGVVSETPMSTQFASANFISGAGETDSDSCDYATFSPVTDKSSPDLSKSRLNRSDAPITPRHGSFPPLVTRGRVSSPAPKALSLPSSRAKSKLSEASLTKIGQLRDVDSKSKPVVNTKQTPSAKKTSGRSGNPNQQQLRTTSHKLKSPRRSSFSLAVTPGPVEDAVDGNDGLTSEEQRLRQNHNFVEKQYRNRLNAQFERLLAALPTEQRAGYTVQHHIRGEGGHTMIGSDFVNGEKRISKAEVLDMATRRIKMLEKERQELQQERTELLQSVDLMSNVAAGRGMGRS